MSGVYGSDFLLEDPRHRLVKDVMIELWTLSVDLGACLGSVLTRRRA